MISHDKSRIPTWLVLGGYPKFKLTGAEQETLLGDYLPFAEVVVRGDRGSSKAERDAAFGQGDSFESGFGVSNRRDVWREP